MQRREDAQREGEADREARVGTKTSKVTEADFSSCGVGPVALGHLSDWVRDATATPVEVVLDGNPIGCPTSAKLLVLVVRDLSLVLVVRH